MNSTPRKLAATSTSSGHLPVICILGTTGVGKSKLSVQLALNCIRQGEVINADTLQVYSASNLDLITNKLPVAEQLGVAHHLMSHVHPNSQYTVGQFVREAQEKVNIQCIWRGLDFLTIKLRKFNSHTIDPQIREIHARNKIPIIVGGTNYYIQSLLWNGSILVSDIDGRDSNPSKLETGGDDKTNYETSSSSAAAANSTTSTSSGVAAVANIDPLLNEKLVRLLKETESDCVAKLEPENRSRIINEMFELLETVDPGKKKEYKAEEGGRGSMMELQRLRKVALRL